MLYSLPTPRLELDSASVLLRKNLVPKLLLETRVRALQGTKLVNKSGLSPTTAALEARQRLAAAHRLVRELEGLREAVAAAQAVLERKMSAPCGPDTHPLVALAADLLSEIVELKAVDPGLAAADLGEVTTDLGAMADVLVEELQTARQRLAALDKATRTLSGICYAKSGVDVGALARAGCEPPDHWDLFDGIEKTDREQAGKATGNRFLWTDDQDQRREAVANVVQYRAKQLSKQDRVAIQKKRRQRDAREHEQLVGSLREVMTGDTA